jgi:hypothetical protein
VVGVEKVAKDSLQTGVQSQLVYASEDIQQIFILVMKLHA